MPDRTLNILLADDDSGDRRQIKRALSQSEIAFDIVEVDSIGAAVAACDEREFDCTIVDYRMPGDDGLRGIAALHARFPFMAIVMITGQGDEVIAAEAMKLGASDYIPKRYITDTSIRRVIETALEKAALHRTIARQREELQQYASGLAENVKVLEAEANEAKRDHLTGLPGRLLFLDLAQAMHIRAVRNGMAVATLFVDLDEFKSINDRYGHGRGDTVLVRTADALRASLRDSDIVGRIGGDEFVVCVAAAPGQIGRTAVAIAQRIIDHVNDIGIGVGCSIGIAIDAGEEAHASVENAIRCADAAMYDSKKLGKNRITVRHAGPEGDG
jgi:diguanylate cyclase (GGDEF)-like protein